MTHWTTEFYRLVDAGDASANELLSPDVRVQVGNHEPTVGLEGLFNGELGRHRKAAHSSVHDFVNIWDIDADTVALDSIVTFHRRDGKDVTLPVMTIVHKNADGLIDGLRLYIDNAPLFEGLTV